MRVARLQPAQLAEISTGDTRQLPAFAARTDIDAAIAEADGTVGRDQSESVEDVSEVLRGQPGDRRSLGANAPRRQVSDDPHRWRIFLSIWPANGSRRTKG